MAGTSGMGATGQQWPNFGSPYADTAARVGAVLASLERIPNIVGEVNAYLPSLPHDQRTELEQGAIKEVQGLVRRIGTMLNTEGTGFTP